MTSPQGNLKYTQWHLTSMFKLEFLAEEQMDLNYMQERVCFEYKGSRLIGGNWVKN